MLIKKFSITSIRVWSFYRRVFTISFILLFKSFSLLNGIIDIISFSFLGNKRLNEQVDNEWSLQNLSISKISLDNLFFTNI